jgi:tetratricopeptide (TPR) repeat protein
LTDVLVYSTIFAKQNRLMKYLLFFIPLFFSLTVSLAQINQGQSKAQLASSFFRDKEYAKAAPLYLELFETTKMNYYFDNYVNCLVQNGEYDEAEKAIKKQLRKGKNTGLQITLGSVYKQKGDIDKATDTFDEILEKLEKNEGAVISVANDFFNIREYDYAEKTYLRGRQIFDDSQLFRSNIAMIYAYTRNYAKMMDEYFLMLKDDENQLPNVEGRINSLLQYDFDNSLRILVKKEILKKIQEDPNRVIYNRFLIWLLVQEQNFEQALNQSIALDRRTKTEETDILNFSKSAAQNNLFDVALKGLDYLSSRKPSISNVEQVQREIVTIEYRKFVSLPQSQRTNSELLLQKFQTILNQSGYTAQNSEFICDYAHFLAFYQNRADRAYEVLDSALNIRELDNVKRSNLKIELADINVFDDNLWGATLIYAQIIDSNKENPIGNDVKLKKAKLGFYLGDIKWAKAQVDALKASTSKLTANDAMELSLLISEYYDMDTIEEPIQLFARGDLLVFQNKDSQAIATYDSVNIKYPGHSLNDRILMRKAQISEKNFQFDNAIALYSDVLENYPASTSADDALYKMALLYELQFKNVEKAQELYKQILLSYPGSIFVSDSRNRYRILRGDIIPVEEMPQPDMDAPAFF